MFIEDLICANELRNQKYPLEKDKEFTANTQSALVLYKKVMQEIGENPDILHAIASCYNILASYDDAISTIQRAIELAPDNGRLHAVLAEYYYLGKLDYEKAATEYRKAIELSPDDVWALRNAARQYGSPDTPITIKEAISWAERVVLLDPGEPISHAHLSELYFENNKLHKAKEEAIKSLLCAQPLRTGWPERIKYILYLSQ